MNVEDILSILSYNRESGVFTWLQGRGRGKKGEKAGTLNEKGYRVIYILGNRIRAHRLAWFIEYGYWPKDQIDHINGNKDDNRIDNLREVDNRDNHLNLKSHKDGRLYGTISYKDKYLSRIRVNGKKIFLGTFDNEKDAHNAYVAAYKKYIKKEPF